TLTSMGFGEAFTSMADFSGFSETAKVSLSNVYHKAKIQVDEEGTVAAAGTVGVFMPVSEFYVKPEPIVVHADHPFVFMLFDRETEAILFSVAVPTITVGNSIIIVGIPSNYSCPNYNIMLYAEVLDCIQEMFTDKIELINIHGDPEGARKHINAWIEEKTRQLIKDLLPAGSIDSETQFAIANAAYFKGSWEDKFDKDQTVKKNFYETPNKIVQVDMMSKKSYFQYSYSEELDCHVVKIPYDLKHPLANDPHFVILLPKLKTENTLEEMMNKMTPELLSKSLIHVLLKEVCLEFPKFSFEMFSKLKETLTSMGFGEAFTSMADFSGFSETAKVSLSNVYHKAKIQVDEEGTVAAAGTAAVPWPMSANYKKPEPIVVHADHPFVFMLFDSKNEAILFSG
ncbi:unnamed protein product, partial [Sphagnum compactum]